MKERKSFNQIRYVCLSAHSSFFVFATLCTPLFRAAFWYFVSLSVNQVINKLPHWKNGRVAESKSEKTFYFVYCINIIMDSVHLCVYISMASGGKAMNIVIRLQATSDSMPKIAKSQYATCFHHTDGWSKRITFVRSLSLSLPYTRECIQN